MVHAVEVHEEEDDSAVGARPRRQTPIVHDRSQDPGQGHPRYQQEQGSTVQDRHLPLAAERGARPHRGAAEAEEGMTIVMTADAAPVAAVPKAMVAIVVGEVARGTGEAIAE